MNTETRTLNSEKLDSAGDNKNKNQSQESSSTENSETTDSGQTSQSSETDKQAEEQMDTSEKNENVSKTQTPRVSPATMLALTGKCDNAGKVLAGDRVNTFF